jgi:tight adherence protein C
MTNSLIPLAASLATMIGLVGAIVLIVLGRTKSASESPETLAVGEIAPILRPPRESVLVRLLPDGYARMLDHRTVLAGRPAGWTVQRLVVIKPVLAAAAALLALLWIRLDPVPFRFGVGLFVVLLAFFVPDLLLYSRGVERQQKIELALPDTLDQMTISVEAGLGFEAAMAKAATNGQGPLAEELIRTLQDMSLGRVRRDAYEALGERTSCIDLRRFTRAIVQADVYGISLADVLRVQAGEMRIKRRQRAEEKAMKVPVKVLFPLMFCILPVIFIVILAPAVINAFQVLG